jgi:glycosyltransferase involved in cell wall biosynthesis
VVVVDDGSTDDSREVIARYRDSVVAVLKPNGGQASAFNTGFDRSRGEVVVFLDADDRLAPSAVERAVAVLAGTAAAKVHWPLRIIDAEGRPQPRVIPEEPLPEGDLRQRVLKNGPFSHVCSPTSGNAWPRAFLERVLPVPEQEYAILADCYLLDLAALYGTVARVNEPQGEYRVHGANRFWFSFDEQLRRHAEMPARHRELLARHARKLGLDADPDGWSVDPWWQSLRAASEEITSVVPPGESFVLIDDCQWGMDRLDGRRAIPFLERQGEYAGRPSGDAEAIGELERLRGDGARFVVVGWPAFWWLDSYPGFARHLDTHFRPAAASDRLKAFDMGVV